MSETGVKTRRRPGLERVLATADRLFYEGGIQATGVDLIVEEAGVSKATLYSHFRTKDDLVVDYLTRRSRDWQSLLTTELEQRGGTPRDRVGIIFDALGEQFQSESYRGCPFINAEAECGSFHPAHGVTINHRAWVMSLFRSLASQAGAAEADRVARRLNMLYDGAMSSAQSEPQVDWAGEAKEAALVILGAL
jgi:AcrR family transcriptional regulator